MIITALALLCCTTLTAGAPRFPATSPTVEINSAAPAASSEDVKPAKPDTPTPKLTAASNEEISSGSGGGASVPAVEPVLSNPVKPATTENFETPRKRAIWYGLMAAGHGTAAFDAWTTRRAISGGYGTEADPLQRPFAHSHALYATTQISPLVMDYVGHRMMRSRYPLMRKFWWVPQAACASVSLGSGIHNYRVVP